MDATSDKKLKEASIRPGVNQKELFYRHLAQTTNAPLALEIIKAEGSKLWDADGKEYIDLIAGISVCNTGHLHPKVVKAIKKQLKDYLHLMVYGEMVQTPQVQYAKVLTDHLPSSINSVYFTNSGSEAVEGALKLAKRVTGRTQIVAFNNSYHGSTQGALSIIGKEDWRNSFRPLLPDVLHLDYNSFEALNEISERTACVIAETIQAEAGVIEPFKEWMNVLQKKCHETGSLLILDEIQTGFGRTGTLWGFNQFDVIPDIVLLGKALGGGMPLGAFIADKKLMWTLTENPPLGHITTFGGHPLCCAAGLASFKVLLKKDIIENVHHKELLFRNQLQHPKINAMRSCGLLIALEFEDQETNIKIKNACLENGVLVDWFLFAPHCMRLAPPLTISEKEITDACEVIVQALGRKIRN